MSETLKAQLLSDSLKNNEGVLNIHNVLTVSTGSRTGRSPKDRFIVLDETTKKSVEWNSINQPIEKTDFDRLWLKTKQYLSEKKTYQQHFLAGKHPSYQTQFKATTELAWHMLFLTNLLAHETIAREDSWEMLVAPKLLLNPEQDKTHSDGIVAFDFSKKRILIAGIQYAGEIKKSIFSVMNYWLPEHNVLSMHCSANEGTGGDVALFFGLSGTGKTTLSADPKRYLIGDDEHGWCDDGIFNIENGCYAKCHALSAEKEPLIYNAIRDFAILENVVLDEEKRPDYDNASLTLNTRSAYPLEYINPEHSTSCAQSPNNVFMLSCDLFGVLPALSKLTAEQALFWFLLGYTAHVGSTEHGELGIRPTFSTCFGAPFFPRNPEVYASLLEERLQHKEVSVYLVNTGYYGGQFGAGGSRYPLQTTRELINHALSGKIQHADFKEGPFGMMALQLSLPNFTSLDPMKLWPEPEQYIRSLAILKSNILDNFEKLPLTPAMRDRLLAKGFN